MARARKAESLLKRMLAHPDTRDLSHDDPALTCARVGIIRKKAFLRRLYEHWYGMLASAAAGTPGPVLEIGSGAGFFKSVLPSAISSELFFLPHVDLVADAQSLCFADCSLGGIVLLDVFHHLPDCGAFLSSASRCLAPGGVLAMIEPWPTSFSGLVYRKLHHEPFEPGAESWSAAEGGPLSGANTALAWIVFERDRELFSRRHPELEIAAIEPITPFAYLLSGGVSTRIGPPGAAFAPVLFAERLLRPFSRSLAMFAFIIIRKKAET